MHVTHIEQAPTSDLFFVPKENGKIESETCGECKFKDLWDVLRWSGPNDFGLAWLEDFWRYLFLQWILKILFFRCLVSRVSWDYHPQATESTKRLAGFRRSCSYHRTGPIYGTAYEARGSSFTLLHFVALKKNRWNSTLMGLVCWEFCLTVVNVDGAGMWTFGLSTHLPACSFHLSLHEFTFGTGIFFAGFLRFSDWWLLDGSSLHYCLCYACLTCVSRKIVVQALSTTFHWAASLYRAYLVGAETRSAGMSIGGISMAEQWLKPRYFRFLPSILGWSYWQRRWGKTQVRWWFVDLMVCLFGNYAKYKSHPLNH